MSIVRRILAGVAAGALTLGFLAAGAAPVAAAPDDAEFTTFSKVVTPPDTSPYDAGEQFSYTISLTCNSPIVDICVGAQVADTLPAPLIFDPSVPNPVVVSPAGATVTTTGDGFTAAFTETGTAGTGLATGQQVSITVFVQVPDDVSADYNGEIVNTATASADNALPKDASVPVVIDVPVDLDSTVVKSVDDHVADGASVPSLPGQPIDYTIGGGNASNQSVDSVVVQDPADGVASPFDSYLDFTGITSITPPPGADQVEIEYLDADGNWVVAYPTGSIPTDFTDIPGVDPPSDVKGLRFTFTSTTGQIPPGENGTIGISSETNDSVLDIPLDESVDVPNTASSSVTVDDTTTDPNTADGDVVISNTGPTVDVEKSFADPTLLAGDSTTATIEAANGPRPVTSMTIDEPTAGTPNLAGQGLTFDGFGDITWPQNATSATITYTYADGTQETLDTTTPDTLPDPTGDVVGFSVTFSGPILPNASAALPFNVTAQAVDGEDDVVSTNDTTSTVTDSTGQTGTDEDAADVTRQPVRVSTVIDKNIVQTDVWDVPGSVTDVTFLASVNDQGENASTVGVNEFIVSDPADPVAGDPPSAFWNTFNLTEVTVGVPANANLTIEYWDGQTWQTLEGPIEGPSPDTSYPIPADLQDDIQGIRFVYTPKDGETLEPGFEVAPSISVATRDQFRTGGSVHDAAVAADPLVVDNTASSTITNPDDTSPEDNSATDGDTINVNPFDPDEGVDLLEKQWLDDDVNAFSDDQRTARISWGTEGLPFDAVAITDDPTAGDDFANIAASTFDAWDLARIDPIDGTLDPVMAYDRISAVELYDGEANDWVDITAEACGAVDTTGTSCDGGFPGYELTEAERASTVGVRLTYVEGTNRGGAGGPAAGTGVAASNDFERNLDLTFQLREEKRSGGPVVGSLHDDTYNSGLAGVVTNTAQADGDGPQPVTDQGSDDITILDTVINTSVSKSFDQDSLPIPPEDTDPSDYPLVTATLVGTNETEANISQLRVDDPARVPAAPTPPPAETTTYDYLNLYSIDSISVPVDATQSIVTLTREGGATTDYSIDEATALTPDDLADVIGFSVVHSDPDAVSIRTQESTVVSLTYQLREFLRDEPTVSPTTADTVSNVASVDASRPGDDPDLDAAYTTDEDSLIFADAVYGVNAGKSISPGSRYEDDSADGYTVTIGGQPTGNVRTTLLTITDDTPTFWNAFEFASFPASLLPDGIGQLRVSALVGVEYAAAGADLEASCPAGPLEECWQTGEWQDAAAGGAITPELPAGVAAADVRGLRFEIRRDAAESNWESPRTPIITLSFIADRLENLHLGPDGEVDSYPVPSTLPGLETAPGESVQGTTTDDVDVHGTGSWEAPNGVTWEADANAGDTTQLLHRVNSISVVKSPGNGSGGAASQQFPPDAEIPYAMTITNTGAWEMTGLELTDQVGTDASGSYLVADDEADPVFEFALTDANGAALPTDGFTGELDETTGVVSITVPDDFVFSPGDVLVIQAHLVFRAGLAPGTPVGNEVSATSDRDFETCEHTANNVPIADTANVEDCAADTTVTPAAAAPISMVKSVKGVAAGVPGVDEADPNYDDLGVLNTSATPTAEACATPNAADGYYVNECVPITRPGGIEQWRISFTNRGNVPADAVGGIDVLPAIGDTGVVVGSPRGSQWAPIFIGNFALQATSAVIQAYYLTSVPDTACNAADIQYSTLGTPIPDSDPCFADVSSRAWIPYDESTPAAELATARALKTVVDYPEGEGLAPGQTGSITFETQTPSFIPDAYDDGLPIAWNTAAAGSRATFEGAEIYQGPVEPVRSGVAYATGEVQLQKAIDVPETWPFGVPDSYDFDVQCTSDGEPVDLVDTAGNAVSPIPVPSDGSLVSVGPATNLPLFSSCTVAENFAQGSTVSYDPPGVGDRSGEVIATRDLTGRDDVAHPFPPDPVDEVTLQVTNTYEIGGFSITKDVERSTAADQDGEPISFDPEFSFTASCTFLGEEVIPEAEQEFTLHDGDSQDFGPLPVGADCEVAETDAAGATTTGIVVTEDGEAQDAMEIPAAFTILPDEDDGTHLTAIAVTNSYTVGSIAITKDVTGAGADNWAADDFQVGLTCTWDEATTNPVYDTTHTIVDGETWTVDNLPTGASCTVSEPDTGGSTEVTISPDQPVIIGVEGETADPVAVNVTNDYRVGSFDIAKTVTGPGVGFSEDVDFVYDYSCTYDSDIVGEGELTISGDGTAGPLQSEVVTGLPVNSDCVITETEDGGADATPTPVTVTIPDEVDGVAQVATADFENRFSAGTIAVTKILSGAGAEDPDVADATYTVHLTCALTADGDPLYDADVEVTGGETVTILDETTGEPLLLPVGTHCWGEETDDAGASDSSVDHDSFEDAAIVVASQSDAPQVLDVAATNTFALNSISIEKEIGGDPAFTEGVTFEILVTCTLDRGPDNPPLSILDAEPVELEGGEVTTLDDIPVGSECWAAEPDSHGASEVVISASEDDPVVVGTQEDITITVTNVFPDAGFTVTKQVDAGGAVNQDGEPIQYDTAFSFTATCEFEGETVLDESFDLTDGQVESFTDLPAGSDCMVTETDQGGASTSIVVTQGGVDDDLGGVTEAEFTLTPDDDDAVTTTVTVTNAYTVGSVAITKAVTGTGADAWGGEFGDFDVRMVCTLDSADPNTVFDATHTMTKEAPGNVWVVDDLPTGADCAVTEAENADGGATQSTVTPSTFVVGDDATTEPVAVTVDNEFRTGALNVLKAVTGPGVPEFSNGPFVFQVTCRYERQTVVDRALIVIGDGTEGPFTSETITGIPVGARCIVRETFAADADVTPPPVTVTITDQEEDGVETVVTAGFLNVFSLGTIQLTKEVDGTAANEPYVQDAVFTVQLTCQLELLGIRVTIFDEPVEIGAGETVPVVREDGRPLKLPYQTHCFAAETDAAGASATAVDYDSYENAAIINVEDEPQLLTVTATNTFDDGSIEIAKTVSGDGDQATGKLFRVEVTCVLDQGSNDPYIALDRSPVLIAGGQTQTIDGLPVGADCWATETDSGGAAAVSISATETDPVAVDSGETVTITIDNRFDPVTPPVPPTPPQTGQLSGTGFDILPPLATVLALLGAGMLLLTRRRRLPNL
ncbi:hypothetical protein ASF62_05610 [Leifsonia sp. Leaf325]|nr:DUF5979 domain-containing protein [Leifsonia sp. Leaf325]KQQ93687.1 hypothetical protein ASF62_05610 [Leifsonia sp. Leaf325]